MTNETAARVFLAGPFKALVDPTTGLLSSHMRERLESILRLLEARGFAVHCAHKREGWGAQMMTPAECTKIDYTEIESSDILLAFPGSPASPGTHIELGWASAMRKKIVLMLERGKEYAFLVRGLREVADVTEVVFDTDEELLKQLSALFPARETAAQGLA